MKNVLVLLLLLPCTWVWSQSQRDLVKPKADLDLIDHEGYALQYSEQHEQAIWIGYVLTKDETVKRYERTDRFIEDPMVKTGSATIADYKGSGYDRGHLAPAADMSWSEIAMRESFYFSNMSPQDPSFNRGIWKKLEAQVRSWAIIYDSIYIVTGPILEEGLATIGTNQVSVPTYYYKAILDFREERKQGIAFILKNETSHLTLESFAISIDSLERVSGLDFYPFLNDSIADQLESNICVPCWLWSTLATETDIAVSTPTTTQCLGKTKSGNRCKIKTAETSGYCHVHTSQIPPEPTRLETSVRCTGTTKKGEQCKRKTLDASTRCSQHK